MRGNSTADAARALSVLGGTYDPDSSAATRSGVQQRVTKMRKRGYVIVHDRKARHYVTTALPPGMTPVPGGTLSIPGGYEEEQRQERVRAADRERKRKQRATPKHPPLGDAVRVVMLAEEKGEVFARLRSLNGGGEWFVRVERE